MMNLTAKQVETFFGELEYFGPRLKALGIGEVRGEITYIARAPTEN